MMKVLFSTGFQSSEVKTATITAFFCFLNKADFLEIESKTLNSFFNILVCGRLPLVDEIL